MINSSRNKRPEVVAQVNPKNDKLLSKINMKTRPGNSSFINVATRGKIAIISDTLCNGTKIKELNHYILNGSSYRESFPGVSSKDLAHHCLPCICVPCMCIYYYPDSYPPDSYLPDVYLMDSYLEKYLATWFTPVLCK